MDVSRILPDLQCSILCEDVRQETSGNFILIGVIGYIRVPKLPVTALKLCVFNRWTAGVGQFTEVVRLIAPDQTTVLRRSEVKFGLREPGQNATNVTVLAQVKLEHPGIYQIEVLVDDVMKLRYPVPVLIVQPPQRQGGAPNPPGPQDTGTPDPGSTPPSPPETPQA